MISYTTFQDALDQALDYLGGNPGDSSRRDCIRAILEAYRDLANAHTWSYLYTHGRIATSAAFDGTAVGATIQYQQTAGSYDYQVTITGATWPAWAGDGAYLRLSAPDGDGGTDMVAYRVDQRVSATILTLTPTLNPGSDIAAGTPFVLYRDTYLLPEDYIAQDQALFERNFGGMLYTHPKEWLYENRYVFAQGTPMRYTITGDPQYPGRLVMRIFPWPYEAKTIDFIYKRRPRTLRLPEYSTGTASISSGLNTVTGVGTTFTPAMVGSVIRFSADGLNPPTSTIDVNPAAFETVITSYSSPTSVSVLDEAPASFSGVLFTVSDPIDIEQGAMVNAFFRGVEKHLGMNRTLKDKPSARAQYDRDLAEAKDADSRSFMGRRAGQDHRLRLRLRDMPINLTNTE